MKFMFVIAAAVSATFVGAVQTTTAISSNSSRDGFQPVSREFVYVQNRGKVDVSSMVCDDETGSPALRRVCYDVNAAYILISVQGAYRQYCGIDRETLAGLLLAPSKDRYYAEIVKGRFACPAGEAESAG